jgi:hypothetical protein
MDFNLIFGAFAVIFGCYTLILRLTGKTEKLGKLEPMKERFGENPGNAIHFTAYTLLPIIAGAIFNFRWLQ